jgi:hypothetical protein
MFTDPIAAKEHDKYRRMWAVDEYKKFSPGLKAASQAFKFFDCKPGNTIRDYGCGVPKAVDWFRKKGIICEGCDIYSMREDVREVTLWDLPADMGVVDFAFSCDVLEHLPEDKVYPAVMQIMDRTRKAAFLQVATCGEGFGDRIGEELHLTIKSIRWWTTLMKECWGCPVEVATDSERHWRHALLIRP